MNKAILSKNPKILENWLLVVSKKQWIDLNYLLRVEGSAISASTKWELQ